MRRIRPELAALFIVWADKLRDAIGVTNETLSCITDIEYFLHVVEMNARVYRKDNHEDVYERKLFVDEITEENIISMFQDAINVVESLT